MNREIRRKLPTHLQGVMNRLLTLDPEAIEALVDKRVECNEAMTEDRTVQVQHTQGVNRLGVLGVLNAILGDAGVDEYLVITPGESGKPMFKLMGAQDAVRTSEH